MEAPPDTAHSINAVLAARPDGTPLAIVAEPDDSTAAVLISVLEMLGLAPVRVRKGSAVLHALGLREIDLILFPTELPDMDGVSLVQVARRLPNCARTRLVASSSVHSENSGVANTLRRLGVIHFFERPFAVARLKHKLREMFPDTAPSKKIQLTVRDAEALALPGAVVVGGIKRPVRLVAGTASRFVIKGEAVPLGQLVRVELKHRQEMYGETVTLDLVAQARVLSSTVVAGSALSECEVVLSRPPLQWDAMIGELPDL